MLGTKTCKDLTFNSGEDLSDEVYNHFNCLRIQFNSAIPIKHG